MDLQFHHNFQNQLPYSPFQKEPITTSMEDMIPTPNSVTRPISRLDSLMSELINESEKNICCQFLTDPYIPNSADWTQESCHFEIHLQFHHTNLNLTNITSLTFWQVILFLKLTLILNVISNLMLVIPFHFLIQ